VSALPQLRTGQPCAWNSEADSDHDFLIVLSDEAYESLPGSPYTYFQRRLREAVGSDCDTVVNSTSGFIESSKDAPAPGLPKGSHAWQAGGMPSARKRTENAVGAPMAAAEPENPKTTPLRQPIFEL